MGEAFLDYFFNGHVPEARGNWDANAAPHDVYPCLGFDSWCAIACYTDEQWRRLRGAMDEPEWAAESRFDTLEGRLANLDELNAGLGKWTSEMTARQVMRLLQREGVPAGIVASGEDLYHDVNLRARGLRGDGGPPAGGGSPRAPRGDGAAERHAEPDRGRVP